MKALLLIASLLLPCVVPAQTVEKACPPPLPQLTKQQWIEKARVAKNAGFLWKIEKQRQVSWLYGTIHVNALELAMPGPTVVQAMREVDMVALELDISTPEKVKAVAAEAAKPVADEKPLDEKTIERIKKYAEALCVPADNFLKLPTSALQAALPVYALRDKGLYPEFMVDAFIGGIGTGLKKKMVALETTQSQMAALDQGVSAEKELEKVLNELESGDSQKVMQQIFDAWSASDLAKFEQFADWCECMRTPEERAQMTRLNEDRNVDMAKQIAQMLDDAKSVFVAVGALHMIGDQGLPALLRERGAVVTYVPLGTSPSSPSKLQAK